MSNNYAPIMADLAGLTLSVTEREWLQHPALGGIILFARNYKTKAQLKALVADIRRSANRHILIAVDQEGGRVQRFKGEFNHLPAAASIGWLFDRDPPVALALAARCGETLGAELQAVGIDFSFAPVLDLHHPASTVLGTRAFHHKPAVVGELAASWISGARRSGMAVVVKHFPGHGGVAGDSHCELPIDRRHLTEIVARDLQPFKYAIEYGCQGVMTAHILFENIDNNPPTFARFWLQDILRESCGFKGAIFSDDLNMQGAHRTASTALERATTALNAGCDMALICNNERARAEILTGIEAATNFSAQTAHERQQRLNAMAGGRV